MLGIIALLLLILIALYWASAGPGDDIDPTGGDEKAPGYPRDRWFR